MLNQLQYSFLVSVEGQVLDPSRPALVQGQTQSTNLVTRLGIRDQSVIKRLSDAIKLAGQERQPGTLWWRKPGEQLGSLVRVRPARERGLAVVTVTNLEDPIGHLDPRVLVEMFSLTPAEAAIAADLFNGRDIAEIASERKVQLETVRGQVKLVLRKTGVASQKQLMLLLSKIALIVSPIVVSPPSGGLQDRAASARSRR